MGFVVCRIEEIDFILFFWDCLLIDIRGRFFKKIKVIIKVINYFGL